MKARTGRLPQLTIFLDFLIQIVDIYRLVGWIVHSANFNLPNLSKFVQQKTRFSQTRMPK
jgi:hypothetical protein